MVIFNSYVNLPEGTWYNQWEISRILKWRYVSTILLAIFCGDISLQVNLVIYIVVPGIRVNIEKNIWKINEHNGFPRKKSLHIWLIVHIYVHVYPSVSEPPKIDKNSVPPRVLDFWTVNLRVSG
jgi:hypothetical protein